MSNDHRAVPLPATVRKGILDSLGIIASIVGQAPLYSADVEVVVEKLVQLARNAEFARWREVKRAGFDPRPLGLEAAAAVRAGLQQPSSVRAAAEGSEATEALFRMNLERRIRSVVDGPPFCGTPDAPPSPSRPRTAVAPALRTVPAPAAAEGGRP